MEEDVEEDLDRLCLGAFLRLLEVEEDVDEDLELEPLELELELKASLILLFLSQNTFFMRWFRLQPFS